jgi:hydrogenase maturation protease
MRGLLVAGIGSESRGDDAAGLLAIRALQDLGASGVDVEELNDPVSLVPALLNRSHAVVIDAVDGGGEPGAVLELVAEDSILCRDTSSHGLGVRHAVELARALGSTPAVLVIGIVGQNFGVGSAPSAAVVRAATEVAAWMKESLECA